MTARNCNDGHDHASEVDACLARLLNRSPAPAVSARVRESLGDAFGRAGPALPEILTLAEVAAQLRLPTAAYGELLAEIPWFEIAGRVRVRRERLQEWIETRERAQATASMLASLHDELLGCAETGA